MAETSIVIELQRLASDSSAKVSELLRKALLVSTKLKLDDFKRWIECELRGYDSHATPPPKYRIVQAAVKAWNPYRGYMPVQIEDSATERLYAQTVVNNALPELEEMGARSGKGVLRQKLPPQDSAVGIGTMGIRFDTYRVISGAQVIGIIESVRTVILEWALKLESDGLLGDGMTFSESDKKRAAESQHIHIANFHGVLGNVTSQNLQIGDYTSIHEQLKEAGVSQKERNELEDILDGLKKACSPLAKETLAQRGLDWLGRNATNLGALAAVFRSWFSHL